MAKNKKQSLASEKKKIAGIIILVVLAGLIGLSVFIGRYMHPAVFLGVFFAVEYLFLVPQFSIRYHKFMGGKASITSWIPLYNELNIFSSVYFLIGIIGYGLVVVLYILGGNIATILPNLDISLISDAATWTIFGSIAVLILQQFIVLGLGWMNIRKIMHSAAEEGYGFKLTQVASELLSKLLLFIPIARMWVIMYMYDDLVDVVDLRSATLSDLKSRQNSAVVEVVQQSKKNDILK